MDRERRYENTLHWLLGKLEGKPELDTDDIELILSKIKTVLQDTKFDVTKIIKG